MKKVFIFILFFFKAVITNSQDTIVDYYINDYLLRVEYTEISRNLEGIYAICDTTDSSRYLLVFKSIKGACQIFKFYQNGMLMISGEYCDAKNFEDSYLLVLDSNANEFVEKDKRLKPLKCCTWNYYSETGKLIKTEKYRKGKPISRKN